jgi:hypothetical protein
MTPASKRRLKMIVADLQRTIDDDPASRGEIASAVLGIAHGCAKAHGIDPESFYAQMREAEGS